MKAILSIDGGGIRGIIPARFLAAIEEEAGLPCHELFDMLAGTSTGGIIALGLTHPSAGTPTHPGPLAYAAADLVDLYQSDGPKIFSRSLPYELETAGGLTGPKYEATGIDGILNQFFGDVALGSALAPVMVTSFDTQAPGIDYLSSWDNKTVAMRDAARSTSAAPTYFAPNPLNGGCMIDGGVFANNPALDAWTSIGEVFGPNTRNDAIVVSLGCGNTEPRLSYAEARTLGLAGWAPKLIDFFMNGNSDNVHRNLAKLVPNYYRFQFDLGSVSQAMDDASPKTIAGLLTVADNAIASNRVAIAELVRKIKAREAK